MMQLKPDKPPPNQILKGRGEGLNYYISNRSTKKHFKKESRTETESENNIKKINILPMDTN